MRRRSINVFIEPHDRLFPRCLLRPETITPPERAAGGIRDENAQAFVSIGRRGRGLGRCDQWMRHVRLFHVS